MQQKQTSLHIEAHNICKILLLSYQRAAVQLARFMYFVYVFFLYFFVETVIYFSSDYDCITMLTVVPYF